MERRPKYKPLTNEEVLANAEKFAGYARNLYGKEDRLADTAALISLAGSALVIARKLNGETTSPTPDDIACQCLSDEKIRRTI